MNRGIGAVSAGRRYAEDRVTHEGERDQRERVGHVLQHVR
jgi:hypothetical protein